MINQMRKMKYQDIVNLFYEYEKREKDVQEKFHKWSEEIVLESTNLA